MINLEGMAVLVGVSEPQLRLWLESGEVTAPKTIKNHQVMLGDETEYYFTREDIEPIKEFARKHSAPEQPENREQFVDKGEQEFFTVGQIASMWQLSPDTIQRLFENEPGVISLGNRNPRGKRKRITLRIPRAVMDRVNRKRSNA